MKRHSYFIYILTTNKNTAIYVGVTKDLLRRIEEHKQGRHSSFTGKYNVTKLVYYEHFGSINKAIRREKQLKSWRRSWKVALVTSRNKEWKDQLPNLTEFTKTMYKSCHPELDSGSG